MRVAGGYPLTGSYSLLLDDLVDAGAYSIAAADLHVNLNGKTDMFLTFWWQSFSDEDDPTDGVYIRSDSRAAWCKAFSFNGGPIGRMRKK